MKLFDKQKLNAYKYIQQSLENDDDTELEIIFGSSEYTNPITKQVFMNYVERNFAFQSPVDIHRRIGGDTRPSHRCIHRI